MTTLTATPEPRARYARAAGEGAPLRIARRPRSLFDGAGGGPTLDDVVSGAWEELTAHAVVECLLCGGEVEPVYGSHALPIGGRCRGCSTTLT